MREILLLDNGSKRPQSTRALRTLALGLGERLGRPIQPVSLAHSDQVPSDRLDGSPAATLEPWLRSRLLAGGGRFLILPLFFGLSAALTEGIPALATRLEAELGPFALDLAPPLCPLPQGEPRLTAILLDRLATTARETGQEPRRLIMVDHGSPSPQVNATRRWLAADLKARLSGGVRLEEAAMERRPGAQYDFNGDLLIEVLRRLGREDAKTPVFVLPVFLFAGRHAGPGGDLAEIRATVQAECPDLAIHLAGLVGDHPGLIDILASRYREATQGAGA